MGNPTAILCTVTWFPDCLQGDVGAAQGMACFFSRLLVVPPLHIRPEKRGRKERARVLLMGQVLLFLVQYTSLILKRTSH